MGDHCGEDGVSFVDVRRPSRGGTRRSGRPAVPGDEGFDGVFTAGVAFALVGRPERVAAKEKVFVLRGGVHPDVVSSFFVVRPVDVGNWREDGDGGSPSSRLLLRIGHGHKGRTQKPGTDREFTG